MKLLNSKPKSRKRKRSIYLDDFDQDINFKIGKNKCDNFYENECELALSELNIPYKKNVNLLKKNTDNNKYTSITDFDYIVPGAIIELKTSHFAIKRNKQTIGTYLSNQSNSSIFNQYNETDYDDEKYRNMKCNQRKHMYKQIHTFFKHIPSNFEVIMCFRGVISPVVMDNLTEISKQYNDRLKVFKQYSNFTELTTYILKKMHQWIDENKLFYSFDNPNILQSIVSQKNDFTRQIIQSYNLSGKLWTTSDNYKKSIAFLSPNDYERIASFNIHIFDHEIHPLVNDRTYVFFSFKSLQSSAYSAKLYFMFEYKDFKKKITN